MIRGLVTIACVLSATVAAVAPSDRSGPLPFFYDLYTFRGGGGTTTVVASFAVPAGGLRSEDGNDEVRYRFDVSFVLSDTARHTITRSDDSVFVSRRRSLDREHLLHTYVEVQTPPTATTIQRVIMTDATTPGVGQLYQSAFPVPDYSGDELMLSDIALGLPGATEGWTRGDVTLALLPTSQFPESAFDVYYEIYNLPPGADYETELAIESLRDTGPREDDVDGRAVRTLFSGRAEAVAGGAVRELRRVESALPQGRYRLTVTVRDLSDGSVATRHRAFEVSGWERGTTLVPAHPRSNRPRTGVR